MSLVSIVRCESYDLAVVREAVRACLRALPEVKALLRTGRRVLLKPNLLSASAVVERAVNTHPAVIRAAAEVCRRDYGCDVAIGDSCGSLAPGSTQRALESTGVPEICNALGATPLDFDRCASTTLDVRQGQVLKRLTVARPALEADVLFSLPKFKTHNLTLLTGGVKNMMGAVPGKGKKDMHVIAPKPALFARALVDLYGVARPHLSLMDAVVGMEGNGPNAGTPRRVGLLMAATDAVALDAVAAAIMGCGQGEVLTTRIAAERGLGTGDLSDIEIEGEPVSAVRQSGFKTPASHVRSIMWALTPTALAGWAFNYFGSATGSVRADRCVLCGECVRNCPTGALRIGNGRVVCDEARCIGCYCCDETCKHDAIVMKRPRAVGLAHRAVALMRKRG